jgi:hypothetical protein
MRFSPDRHPAEGESLKNPEQISAHTVFRRLESTVQSMFLALATLAAFTRGSIRVFRPGEHRAAQYFPHNPYASRTRLE